MYTTIGVYSARQRRTFRRKSGRTTIIATCERKVRDTRATFQKAGANGDEPRDPIGRPDGLTLMARRHSTAAPSAAALDDRARTHARSPAAAVAAAGEHSPCPRAPNDNAPL